VDAASARELRLRLKIRWRNTLAFTVGGLAFLAIGAACTQFVGVGSKWILAAVNFAIGLVFLGIAAYWNRSITEGETRLRVAGVPSRVARTLLPFERRTLCSPLPRDQLLSLALAVLQDPALGLRKVRRTRRGLRALKPEVTREPWDGLAVVVPLDVQVWVRSQQEGSDLEIAIQPSILWKTWPAMESAVSWVEASEGLADQLVAMFGSRAPTRLR
jgi:hypothetical protein